MAVLINLALQHVEPDRPWLEFGVANGNTLRQLAEYAPVVYGFDWFNGLPEDWRDENGNLQDPKGKFRCDIPKDLPKNAVLIVGLFQDTLPQFLGEESWKFGLIHIDCDLYSSTKFVLEQLEPHLDEAIMAFDEIRGFPAGKYHEGRAWTEFINRGKYSVRLLGHQHSAGAIYKLRKI